MNPLSGRQIGKGKTGMPIKRSVSFYSYQKAYYIGEKSLEQLIDATANIAGAEGVEVLAEQSFPGNFPKPKPAFVSQWKEWMERYHTKPTCMDSFIDYMLYKGRICNLDEQVQMMGRDLELAAKLGFPVIRVLCPVRKEIVEASIPIAEYYGVKMGLEVHSPMTLKSRWVNEYLEMAEKSNSKYVGIIPDFSIFQKLPPHRAIQNALDAGADPEIIAFIISSCKEGMPAPEIIGRVKERKAGPLETGVAMGLARTVYSDPKWLYDIAKFIFHVHGKFYDMDENSEETCINYSEPIRILKDIGYDGYISSEFEGQGLYDNPEEMDEIEQVRRHQAFLKRLIGE